MERGRRCLERIWVGNSSWNRFRRHQYLGRIDVLKGRVHVKRCASSSSCGSTGRKKATRPPRLESGGQVGSIPGRTKRGEHQHSSLE